MQKYTRHSLYSMFTKLELTMPTRATLSESQISIFMNLSFLFSQIKALHISGNAVTYESTGFNRKISISIAIQRTHPHLKRFNE